MPSQGVVVASADPDDPDHWDNFHKKNRHQGYDSKRKQPARQQPPLRLLVVGDSLAAGVGIRESCTPILPAAIASTLSRELNGRVIYWKCVGTPGASSSLLVNDIYHLDDDESLFQPAMLKSLRDWQRESKVRAQQRMAEARDVALEWWEHRNDEDYYFDEETQKEPESIDPKSPQNPVLRWLNARRHQVQRDLKGLGRVVRTFDPRRKDDQKQIQALLKQQTLERQLTRRRTVDPELVGPYDIAVVLTGLNDLKDAFLPFMMSAQRKRELKDAQAERGDSTPLVRILHALEDKMNITLPLPIRRRFTLDEDGEHPDLVKQKGRPEAEKPKISSSVKRRHEPLIVFPALPIEPIEPNQRAPLNWFVRPIIHAMERNKQRLAEMYPGLVVFIEAPSREVFRQIEKKEGPLWDGNGEGIILLELSDNAHRQESNNLKSKTEMLMREHYKSWFVDAEEVVDDEEEFTATFSSGDRDAHNQYRVQTDGVIPVPTDSGHPTHVGASLISCDGIHPNDAGYVWWA